jgi:hypothetical protein
MTVSFPFDHAIAAPAAYVVASILVGSGAGKVLAYTSGRPRAVSALDTLFPRLPKAARARAWAVVGALELGLAALVFVVRRGSLGAAAFFGLGAVYLLWAKLFRPGLGCGCTQRSLPITTRTIARSLLLCLCALLIANNTDTPVGIAETNAIPFVVLGVTLAALSEETRVWWYELRLLARSFGGLLKGFRTDEEAIRHEIEETDAWTSILAASRAVGVEPLFIDRWRRRGWYYLEYAIGWAGKETTLICAYRVGSKPRWITISVVEVQDERAEVAMHWDSLIALSRAYRGRETRQHVPSLI